MVKTSQHPAGAGHLVKLKRWNFYTWFILFGLTREIFCADAVNEKQIETQTISTTSSNDDVSSSQAFTEESPLDETSVKKSDYSKIYRFSRAVPRYEIASASSTENKQKNERQPDYVLKIPLSLLRQYELYRILRLQENEDNGNYKKRNSVIPLLRYGRSDTENDFDINAIYSILQHLNSEQDNLTEDFLEYILKKENDNTFPFVRNSRSMLLLSSPKSEETTKEKPIQTFVLPYPRPGRANNHNKIGKSKNGQLILPYPRPGRSSFQNKGSRMQTLNGEKQKYILPVARLGRSSFDLNFEKDEDSIGDWMLSSKSNPLSLKMNKEKLSDIDDENNSFFVIPYPRPGKKSIYKLKNRNQEEKNSGKEMSDYVLPYPRPGKKSGRENLSKYLSNKNKEAENIDSHSLILPYLRPGRGDENSLDTSNTYENSGILNSKQNIDIDNVIEHRRSEIMPLEEFQGEFLMPNKKIENKFILPYLRAGRNFDKIVPYPRPGPSHLYGNEASNSVSNGIYTEINKFQLPHMGLQNLDNSVLDNVRFKRSISAVTYPRSEPSNAVPYLKLRKSNIVVPYSKSSQSNSVVPYPRLGRSNSVVPYPRIGKSDASVFNSKLNKSASVVFYPKLKRSNDVIPYPRLGRSNFPFSYSDFGISKRGSSVVPYPRLGRSDSIVPYPRPGRSESVLPYPRPGRTESVVPYPRLGRADSVVPYPRPGRAESIVPYPRPGRTESIVPYPRPGRAEFVVPYPRPGRSDSVVPYPRLGRSHTEDMGKTENWFLPNLRPDSSNLKEDISSTVGYIEQDSGSERSIVEDNLGYTDANTNLSGEVNAITRYDRASGGQGYVLPHPRIGRSLLKGRKKRESIDTDTIIPYPRLGRSDEETITHKSSPEIQNSVHKLNKHMLTSVDDSVYLLPYPRPGRYLE